MKLIQCNRCGSSEFIETNGYRICRYCDAKYRLFAEDVTAKGSSIELNDDISRLLEKCKKEPWNAKKYANLILDIDASNVEARKYL